MQKYMVILVCMMLLFGLTGLFSTETAVASPFAGGNGTVNDPYRIGDVYELQNMSMYPEAHYILVNNIDASLTSGWNSGAGFEPVGDPWFNGTLDGQGYSIDGLYIDRPSAVLIGLFELIGPSGLVENVDMINVNLTGYGLVGGLAGAIEGTVTHCYATGDVIADVEGGGLIGSNNGTVSYCYSSCDVNGTSCGGLIGTVLKAGTVTYSHATGNVTGSYDLGGLVGASFGPVSSSYATGDVSGTGNRIGGLIGVSLKGDVSHCSATGHVNGDNQIGGLIGENYVDISLCHAIGNVTGTSNLGGLVGKNLEPVSLSYATGDVSGDYWIGGLIGDNEGNVSNCYATGDTDGIWWVSGFIGYNAGNVTDCHATGDANGTLYVSGLIGENYDCTVTNCYALGDAYGIREVGGLIGRSYDYSKVYNCYATGNVDGFEIIGGLIGYNQEFVTECYAIGSVTGDFKAGGLIGFNFGTAYNCYAKGAVDGDDETGGLIGYNYGTTDSCYSVGAVTGIDNVGGLIGNDTGYVLNCFWDNETSGQSTSDGGTGKYTAEMKDVATYTDLSTDGLCTPWDFVGDPYHDTGKEDIWNIHPKVNDGYPFFSWQGFEYALYMDKDVFIGKISIWNDCDNIYVKYTLYDHDWFLKEIHLDVDDSPEINDGIDDMPQTKKGNPKLGKFTYGWSNCDPMVFEKTIVIDTSDEGLSGEVLIAAYAGVKYIECGPCEGAWAASEPGDNRFVDKGNWATYVEYVIQPCSP